jgi:outer membrane protein
MKSLSPWCLALILVGVLPLAGAADSAPELGFSSLWERVLEHDPALAAARYAHEAGATASDQASTLWRPSLQASALAGRMDQRTDMNGAKFSAPTMGTYSGANFSTSVNQGNLQRWAVSARQPLFSLERLAQGRELDLSAQMAELKWQGDTQRSMMRTVQNYLNLALAQTVLEVNQRQEQALEKTMNEMKERYRLGDRPITDTHEANARWQAARAARMAAELDVVLKRTTLANSAALADEQCNIRKLKSQFPAQAEGKPLKEWLGAADAGNPGLQLKRLEVSVGEQEIHRYAPLAGSSLDVVGEVSRDRLSGSGDFGPASNITHSGMVGIQLTIPLYTGGMQSAKHDQAQALANQSRFELEQVKQQVAEETRAAWTGLSVNEQRSSALATALQASEDRLKATQLGWKIGDRSTLDLLNAQSDAANARLSLMLARVQWLLNRLELAMLSGGLNEAVLKDADAVLESSGR